MKTDTPIDETVFPAPAQLETPTDKEQLSKHIFKHFRNLIARHSETYGLRSEAILIVILDEYIEEYFPAKFRSSYPDSLPDIYDSVEKIIDKWDRLMRATSPFGEFGCATKLAPAAKPAHKTKPTHKTKPARATAGKVYDITPSRIPR